MSNDNITIQVNKDGQVWVLFDATLAGTKGHRQAMLNLNNIVLAMDQRGINRGICMDAISIAGHKEQNK